MLFARRPILQIIAASVMVILIGAHAALASGQRVKIEAFLETTGFDVALESIKLSAGTAPEMLGLDAEDFGAKWSDMTGEVFDVDVMHDLAVDILEQTLEPDLLDHAATFYSSGLGKRLVAAENNSHMVEDDAAKAEAGEAIVAGLVRLGSDRIGDLRRMIQAVDASGSAVKAIHEIQVRFLMAAAGAGVIELQMGEADLRSMLETREGALRRALLASSLSGAAYTYQAFSDDEVADYADALEHPKMIKVYELMNAVQFEVMANRFETLAAAMADLQPSSEL